MVILFILISRMLSLCLIKLLNMVLYWNGVYIDVVVAAVVNGILIEEMVEYQRCIDIMQQCDTLAMAELICRT